MRFNNRHVCPLVASCMMGLTIAICAHAADPAGSIELIGEKPFDAWKKPTGNWTIGGGAELKADQPKLLTSLPGTGIIWNGASGKTTNLVTLDDFADVDAHFEFLVPKGSNSGVKFQSVYEIQISDSFGVARPTASQCGGIYPRAEMLPRYHHIDEGTPPRLNAARPAGAWQTLDVTFLAPRFSSDGKKIQNACFERVVLNGQVIHEHAEVKTPTGHIWRLPEKPSGPILLQGDHGPVAFRNIRVARKDHSPASTRGAQEGPGQKKK